MSARKNAPKKPVTASRFSGRVAWTGADENSEGVVTRAIDRGTEIAMDIEVDGGYRYSVLLHRKGTTLVGSATCIGELSPATCSADEFIGETGRVLAGKWLEDGNRHDWWVRLVPETVDDD